MRRLVFALAGAAALTGASAANATVTLGSTGTLAGSNSGVTSSITNNATVPNTIQFDTIQAVVGTDTSFIDFIESYASAATFSITTATGPASTVTLLNVLTGETMDTSSTGGFPTGVASSTGSSYSLNLSANLAANTWYRFVYSANMGQTADLSGTASFNSVPSVPEPATWAMMLVGFGGIGLAMRRRRRPVLAQIA